MSTDAQQFLNSFDALPPKIQTEVAAAILRRAGEGGSEREDAQQERLREQIQEGIDSPGVPADEAIARLRRFARGLTKGPT